MKNVLRIRIADRVLPKATGIRVVSQRIATSIHERYGATIVAPVVIPVMVRITDAPAVPLPDHSFTFALIAASRLETEKHIEDILQALAYVRTRYPATGLFIAGEGSQKHYLKGRARALGIRDAVIWLGRRSDVRQLMQSAQAFIQASAYEGYGMTLIEAALAHLPIITTDVGIVGDVLHDETEVLVAPTNSAADLATHIAHLIEDNQLRMVLKAGADHAVREHLAAHANQPEEIANDIAHAAGLSA